MKQIGYLDSGKVLLECSETEHKLFLALAKTAAGKTRYDQQMTPSRGREGIDADLAPAFEALIEWMDVKDASNELRHLAKVIDGKIGLTGVELLGKPTSEFKPGHKVFVQYGFDKTRTHDDGVSLDGKSGIVVSYLENCMGAAGHWVNIYDLPNPWSSVTNRRGWFVPPELLLYDPLPPDLLTMTYRPGDKVFVKYGYDAGRADNIEESFDGKTGTIDSGPYGGSYDVSFQLHAVTTMWIDAHFLAPAPPDPPADPPGYTIK